MDKIKLKKLLDSFDGDENDLYNAINFVNIQSNQFNSNDYKELLYKTMYLFHRMHGIESIYSKYQIPVIAEKNISYSDFKKYLEELHKYEIDIELLPRVKNHSDNIVRIAASKLLDMGSWNWTRIYSSKLIGQDIAEQGKMYISIDNKDLYMFANLLLEKCLKQGIKDYEFKVNNDDSKTRSDNVVIYFTTENFSKYISLVNQIILENPSMQLNAQNILGYSINSNIKIAKDYENGKESFTRKVCKTIIALRQRGVDNSKIIESIDSATQKYLSDIIKLNNRELKGER